MADRPLRDRLGEALRLALHHPGKPVPWLAKRDKAEEVREHWRCEADRLLMFASECGVSMAGMTDGRGDQDAEMGAEE